MVRSRFHVWLWLTHLFLSQFTSTIAHLRVGRGIIQGQVRGYTCCHSTVRISYCTGEVGKHAAAALSTQNLLIGSDF